MPKIIGIDLGTTNSVVAVMDGDNPIVIANEEGGRTTPSVVAFTAKGERLVGQVAKRQRVTNPENTIYSIKRFMGRRLKEVPSEIQQVPFKVTEAANGDVRVKALGKDYSPPEISALILQKLRKAAEDHLGEKVEKAVITEATVLELCRLLNDSKVGDKAKWPKLQKIIKDIKEGNDAESVRYAVLGYFTSVLLSGGWSMRTARLITYFSDSFMYSGWAGFTAACFLINFGENGDDVVH